MFTRMYPSRITQTLLHGYARSQKRDNWWPFFSLTDPFAAEELKHWEKVVFAFDMDHHEEPSGNYQRSQSTSNPTNNPRQPPVNAIDTTEGLVSQFPSRTSEPQYRQDVEDAALLAQFAAGTGEFDQTYSNMFSQGQFPPMAPPPGYYGNPLHHNNAPPQLPPISSLDFPQHAFSPTQGGPSYYNPQHASPSTDSQALHSFGQNFGSLPNPSDMRQRRGSQARSRSPTASSPEVEQTEDDQASMVDEKRRRNTAASARFRIKKKQKTIGLERSVSDLSGRAEELEREVADLWRENGWLKEIVMLKGARFAASDFNHSLALSQAAALARGHVVGEFGPVPSGSGTTQQEEGESEASSSESSEEEAPRHKGKGKKKSAK